MRGCLTYLNFTRDLAQHSHVFGKLYVKLCRFC